MLSLTQTFEYNKIRKLGHGTYGKVYACSNHQNQEVAIKKLLIPPVYENTIVSLREMDIMLSIESPFCLGLRDVSYKPPFYDTEIDEYPLDRVFFIMDKGELSGTHFIKLPSVSWVDKKLFAIQIMLGVEYLHSRGIYHRDLKPDNIICFLNPNGTLKSAKITDYGLSIQYTHQTLSQIDMVTPWYRAPEISLAKDYDYKIDVWSIGCILFELVQVNCQVGQVGTGMAAGPFIKGDSDVELLNALISSTPFPIEDYILAKAKFGPLIISNFQNRQNAVKRISSRLSMVSYEIALFNSLKLQGRDNTGTYDQLINVIEGCLMVDPKRRLSITEAINLPFFEGQSAIINKTRAASLINKIGEWIDKPIGTLLYQSGSIRKTAMKWFKLIHSVKQREPVNTWYSDRILFHAIDLFDRYNLRVNIPDNEFEILTTVNTFLFISSKYFHVMDTPIPPIMYMNGIAHSDIPQAVQRLIQIELYVVKDIFKGKLYYSTIYEEADVYLTQAMIKKILNNLYDEVYPSGIEYPVMWSKMIQNELKDLPVENDLIKISLV